MFARVNSLRSETPVHWILLFILIYECEFKRRVGERCKYSNRYFKKANGTPNTLGFYCSYILVTRMLYVYI